MNRRSLLQAFGAGTAMSLAPPAAFAQGNGRWLKLESPNFIMYSSASEESTREELAALEGFYSLITRIMPRKALSPAKLPIYVTRTERDFEATAPHYRNSMVMGYYTANTEGTVAVSKSLRYQPRQRDMPRNVRADDARVILFHEYTHHYVLANNRTGYPAWYIEGIAEFLSTAEFTNTGVEVGKFTQGRAYSLLQGKWLEIEKFLKRPDVMTGEEAGAFYAQAWLATHYLFVTPERAKGFDRYVKALQQGGDVIDAFEPAFGITPAVFDKELREYKRKPIQFWPLPGILPTEAGISVQRMSNVFDNLLLPMVYLQRLPASKSAADTIRHVRDETKRHKDNIDAQRAAAWVEIWYGDLDAARKQVDGILAVSADNADTQHLSGLCDLRMAYAKEDDAVLFKRAQNAFGRAHQINDSRAATMFRYFEAGLGATGEVDDHLMEVLIGAYQLAPQVASIAATTANALMSHERYDEAAMILRPLAANPHGGEFAQKAEQWLASALAKERAGFTFIGTARAIGEDGDEA
jgi:hypothetical protein